MKNTPENLSELLTRLSLAADYIQNQETSGTFPLKPYNWAIHLQSISFLYTYAVHSGRLSFYKTAERCFKPILERVFEYGGNAILVCNEKSNTSWNSLAAICCFKSKRKELGKRLIHAVRDVLHGKESALTKSEAHKAYPAIAFLWINESQDIVRGIAQNIIKGAITIDPVSAWLLRIVDHAKYSPRIRAIVAQFNKVNPVSMNSLFAGMAQQTHVANGDFHPGIFELQRQLQITDDSDLQGAFIHNRRNDNARLDYAVQNALSFLQHTQILTELECCL